jgi:hypothetical protein
MDKFKRWGILAFVGTVMALAATFALFSIQSGSFEAGYENFRYAVIHTIASGSNVGRAIALCEAILGFIFAIMLNELIFGESEEDEDAE